MRYSYSYIHSHIHSHTLVTQIISQSYSHPRLDSHRQNHTAPIKQKSHSHIVVFPQSFNHTIILAHAHSNGGVVGGVGAGGRPALTCLHLCLPTSCSGMSVLSREVDGHGSLKMALLAEGGVLAGTRHIQRSWEKALLIVLRVPWGMLSRGCFPQEDETRRQGKVVRRGDKSSLVPGCCCQNSERPKKSYLPGFA